MALYYDIIIDHNLYMDNWFTNKRNSTENKILGMLKTIRKNISINIELKVCKECYNKVDRPVTF